MPKKSKKQQEKLDRIAHEHRRLQHQLDMLCANIYTEHKIMPLLSIQSANQKKLYDYYSKFTYNVNEKKRKL